MGSATAIIWPVAGLVLGLERFGVPHELGSSHGVNRIIRLAYAEDPRYVPLLRRSYTVVAGAGAGSRRTAAHHYRRSSTSGAKEARRSTDRCDRAPRTTCHTTSSTRPASAPVPGCRFPPDFDLRVSGGCRLRHVRARDRRARCGAVRRGADVRTANRSSGWEADDAGVSVRTDRDDYRARSLVVTAGRMGGKLVPLLQGLAIPERQVLIWTEPIRPDYFRSARFRSSTWRRTKGASTASRSTVCRASRSASTTICAERVDPDTMDRDCHPEDERVLREGIRPLLPGRRRPDAGHEDVPLHQHRRRAFRPRSAAWPPRVAIAAGFSGHGYKFCSVVGEIMADLALDGGTRWDLELFKLERLTKSISDSGFQSSD